MSVTHKDILARSHINNMLDEALAKLNETRQIRSVICNPNKELYYTMETDIEVIRRIYYKLVER